MLCACAFPGLQKTSPEALDLYHSALLVLDICSYSHNYCEKRLYLILPSCILYRLQYTSILSLRAHAGLPCIPKQQTVIASQLHNIGYP